jgi:hypothetical protein
VAAKTSHEVGFDLGALTVPWNPMVVIIVSDILILNYGIGRQCCIAAQHHHILTCSSLAIT